jgi:hypothetical protein
MKQKRKTEVTKRIVRIYGDVHSPIVGYIIDEEKGILHVHFVDGWVFEIDAHAVGADTYLLCVDAATHAYGLQYLAETYCSRMYRDDGLEALAFFDYLRHGGKI